jgi:hypothetical protein
MMIPKVSYLDDQGKVEYTPSLENKGIKWALNSPVIPRHIRPSSCSPSQEKTAPSGTVPRVFAFGEEDSSD